MYNFRKDGRDSLARNRSVYARDFRSVTSLANLRVGMFAPSCNIYCRLGDCQVFCRTERNHNRCSKLVDVDSDLLINVFSNVTDTIALLTLRLTIYYFFLVYGVRILCSFSQCFRIYFAQGVSEVAD